MKLSVVISAFNEEKVVEECLKSVKSIADEIIFIDNSSEDNTVKIAKKYTSKIFKKTNNKMLNVNKNYGISKATGDFILVLDADERVTHELAEEIKNVLKNNESQGYKIPRKNIIFNKWIKHTGWYPDYQTRLFKSGKGKFEEKHNHEQLTVDGKVSHLNSNIKHQHYDSISQFLNKMFSTYTDDQVHNLVEKGYYFKHSHIISFPFNEFVSRFFAREGYKDGFHGLALSLLQAFDHLVVILKLWEKNKFEELDEQNTMQMIKSQIKTSKKELKYWTVEKDLKTATPLKRAILKAKRKIV